MSVGNGDGGGPAPPDDEDRGLLRGLPGDGEGSQTEPRSPPRRPGGAAPPASGDDPDPRSAAAGSPADLAAALESLAAGQRRIEAQLGEALAALSEVREAGPDFAELKRTIETATDWTNNIKAGTEELLASASKMIEGQKGARRSLDEVVGQQRTLVDGLKQERQALDKGLGALRALWKTVDERLEELATGNRERTDRYRAWTDEAAAHRQQMAALSKHLRSSGPQLLQSVTENREAQLDISLKTFANVREFKTLSDRLLDRLDEGGKKLLAAIRREWTDTRRWTVPALSAMLILAVPSFAAVGAFAQSQFGVFDPYDDTDGWKRGVWTRHGRQVKECLIEAGRKRAVVRCSFDVTYP